MNRSIETRVAPLQDARNGFTAPVLSQRDFHVLSLLIEGLTDKEIARDVGVSVFTVHKSMQSILRYTNTSSRTQAAVTAIKRGLVHLS